MNFTKYSEMLQGVLADFDWSLLNPLAEELKSALETRATVFLCGNGGSAANANHLANDFIYGVNPGKGGLNVVSLSANSAVMTCLGNDTGYENIFSNQLRALGKEGDILIVLSGSGNSSNILTAVEQASSMGIKTFAILGFTGGKCKFFFQPI